MSWCYLAQLRLGRRVLLGLEVIALSWLRVNGSTMREFAPCTAETLFVVDVVWDEVRFTYQWVLPTALVPKRTFAFPDKLAERNVSLIRKLLIRIHHVDNYTGMVKHNFGGPGLREGLRIQVEKLCQSTLQQMYEISHLHIHFRNDSQIMSVDQAILRPFMNLTNTRTLKLTGSITADLASHYKPSSQMHIAEIPPFACLWSFANVCMIWYFQQGPS